MGLHRIVPLLISLHPFWGWRGLLGLCPRPVGPLPLPWGASAMLGFWGLLPWNSTTSSLALSICNALSHILAESSHPFQATLYCSRFWRSRLSDTCSSSYSSSPSSSIGGGGSEQLLLPPYGSSSSTWNTECIFIVSGRFSLYACRPIALSNLNGPCVRWQ